MKAHSSKFPFEVKSGSSVVKIYRTKRSNRREYFEVKWYLDGRHSKQVGELRAAIDFAKQKADELRRQTSSQSLTRNQVLEYSEAKRLCGNESLVAVVKECLKAREMTEDQIILAAKQFANTITHHETLSATKVCKLFVEAKRAAGIKVGLSYKNTFPLFLDRFGALKMDSITTSQLQHWLNGFDNHGTRNTHRKRIVTLFRWSRKNGYLPKNVTTEAEDTESALEPPQQIGIIDGATLTACLNVIAARHKHYVPALALATLCGMRRSEVHGQDWEDIHLDRNFLRVTAAKPGTAQNRYVPICERAAYYLRPHCVESGQVCSNLAIDRIRHICTTAGTGLPSNCFRHSFISYRVALTGDVARTSLEAGNSPEIIHKYYRELVTKEQAVEWFSV